MIVTGGELRQALRSLLGRPGWTLVVVLTLGLGIGANAAVIGLAHAVFVQALPYPEAHRLVAVESIRGGEDFQHSYLNYLDLRRDLVNASAFGDLAIFAEKPFNVMVGGAGVHVPTELVSAGYFGLLGQAPRLGRVFSAEEDALPGGRHVAVLSDGFWRRHFTGEDSIDGLVIRLNGEPFEVVGVMAPGFHGLSGKAELWIPATAAATLLDPGFLAARVMSWFDAVARLSDTASVAAAGGAAEAAMTRLVETYPDDNRGRRLDLVPLRRAWFGDLYAKIEGLAASAVLVLLLASVNVASLMWARTLERRREIALRSALGAGRGRLVGQLLTESLILALSGVVLALVLVRWSLDALLASSPLELRGHVAVEIGPAVGFGVLLLGLAASLVFGLVPALRGTRLDLRRELTEGGGGAPPPWRRFDLLVTAEVALAFLLLYGALVAADRFERLSQTDLGFRTDRLVTMRLDLWGEAYRPRLAKIGVGGRLLSELRDVPDVEAVALVGPFLPGDGDSQLRRLTVESFAGDPEQATSYFQIRYVSTGYFEMMEIDFLEGRPFELSDGLDNLVAVVSASAAERCWGERSALGRRLRLGTAEVGGPPMTVVGVVSDLGESGFARRSGPPYVYLYMRQQPPSFPPTLNVLLRAEHEVDQELLSRLRETVQSVVPDLPAHDVRTMESRLDSQLDDDRFLVRLTAIFTALALVLAAAGIYGLASYRLSSRARELGVRLALGSTPAGLLRRALGQGLTLALRGGVAGAVVAWIVLRGLERRLGESLFQPFDMVRVAALLAVLSLAATWWPAWRASRVDPMTTLREE